MCLAVKSSPSVTLKLGVMIGPVSENNLLTFGDDPVPGHFSRSIRKCEFESRITFGEVRGNITSNTSLYSSISF